MKNFKIALVFACGLATLALTSTDSVHQSILKELLAPQNLVDIADNTYRFNTSHFRYEVKKVGEKFGLFEHIPFQEFADYIRDNYANNPEAVRSFFSDHGRILCHALSSSDKARWSNPKSFRIRARLSQEFADTLTPMQIQVWEKLYDGVESRWGFGDYGSEIHERFYALDKSLPRSATNSIVSGEIRDLAKAGKSLSRKFTTGVSSDEKFYYETQFLRYNTYFRARENHQGEYLDNKWVPYNSRIFPANGEVGFLKRRCVQAERLTGQCVEVVNAYIEAMEDMADRLEAKCM